VVRVNDRGPFARGRIIDLSKGAAEALGMRATGHGAVRVRVVAPDERDRARLRHGKPAAPRPDADPRSLAFWRSQLAASGM
jgi:rare lipoprotein A